MKRLECPICKKEIKKGDRILAFDEFIPTSYDWDNFEIDGMFDEVIPVHAEWTLAHYFCIFKKS